MILFAQKSYKKICVSVAQSAQICGLQITAGDYSRNRKNFTAGEPQKNQNQESKNLLDINTIQKSLIVLRIDHMLLIRMREV